MWVQKLTKDADERQIWPRQWSHHAWLLICGAEQVKPRRI